jgi:hypothetical protein
MLCVNLYDAVASATIPSDGSADTAVEPLCGDISQSLSMAVHPKLALATAAVLECFDDGLCKDNSQSAGNFTPLSYYSLPLSHKNVVFTSPIDLQVASVSDTHRACDYKDILEKLHLRSTAIHNILKNFEVDDLTFAAQRCQVQWPADFRSLPPTGWQALWTKFHACAAVQTDGLLTDLDLARRLSLKVYSFAIM